MDLHQYKRDGGGGAICSSMPTFVTAGAWDSEECLCSYMPGLCREPGDEGRDGDGVKDRSPRSNTLSDG